MYEFLSLAEMLSMTAWLLAGILTRLGVITNSIGLCFSSLSLPIDSYFCRAG